jgi:hypothetical protein
MRRLLLVALLIALPVAASCKKAGPEGDAGADAAPSASAPAEPIPDAAAEASASAAAPHGAAGYGPPMAGGACHPGTDTLGCSPDHSVELTCTGGTWRPMQACRGAGVCKGAGSAVTCDVGNLLIGDPCVPGNPAAKCVLGHAVQQCSGGTWHETVCMPPSTCKNGPNPVCK